MKTYRRKFTKKSIRDSMARKKETRDGILWHIDSANKCCRIKIQGSDKLIVAHYPRNQKVIPPWLRLGNSVRVVHREGIRGFLEVTGEGRAIPSPVSGGSTFPDIGGLSDGIMSGMVMTETTPLRDGVFITTGTYRINSITYPFSGYDGQTYIIMDDPAPMVMGVLPTLKMGIIVLEVDSAPAVGLFRYDIYVVGVNGIPDYIKGDEVASNPVIPSVPSHHILINYILRIGGDIVVEDSNIGIAYTTPRPVIFILTIDSTFPWDAGTDFPEIDILVVIKDIYGNQISSSDGWILTLTKIVGTGQIWSLDTGYNDDEVSQQLVNLSSYTFKYRRDQTVSPEISPHFSFVLDSRPSISGFSNTILLDNIGDPI